MPKLRNGSKGDSNPGSLERERDCESGILPLSYRAPVDDNKTYRYNSNKTIKSGTAAPLSGVYIHVH